MPASIRLRQAEACPTYRSVTAIDAVLAGSTALVAVTVMVCLAATTAGAVYTPVAEIVPTCGLMLHVMEDGAAAIVTIATKRWLCPAFSMALPGLTVTAGRIRTVVLADFVGSATLVAVTVTTAIPTTVAGAVYMPDAEMLPVAGEILHVTRVSPLPPVTVAVHCSF